MNHLEAERYENAALRDQISKLKLMHLSAESELMTAQEREKMLRKEVVRLTAELAEEKASRVMAEEAYDEASKWYAAAVAREKALLAITGQMLDGKDFRGWDEDEAAGYQTACDEWDRRARGRT